MKLLTFEEIDNQVARLETEHAHKLEPSAGVAAGPEDPKTILGKICAVVTIAAPILEFAMGLFTWIKPSWKPKIQAILDLAKNACAASI